MKHLIYYIAAAALAFVPVTHSQAQSAPSQQASRLSVSELTGEITLASLADTATQAPVILYSPYVPKAPIYNAPTPLFKVSIDKEPIKDRSGKPTGDFRSHYYFEIPDSLIERQFMAVTRLAEVPAGFAYAPHQEMNELMMHFTLSPDSVFLQLKQTSNAIISNPYGTIRRAVDLSNMEPILKVFKIESHKKGVYRIEANSLLLDDRSLGLHPTVKNNYRISGMDPARSEITSIHAYPANIEFRTTRTYGSDLPAMATRDGFTTLTLSHSIILLPRDPMMPRLSDPRVGYNRFRAPEFTDSQQTVDRPGYITRWRLEPKSEEDAQHQRNGELIEPQHPITYYIDPAFPAQWHPYIVQGVAEWQKAFEQAGWKNAIQALEWPTGDSTICMEDIRYNVIRYMPSTLTNVDGEGGVYDLRSGEYLNTPIYFFAGAMQHMRNNYVADCGAVDTDCHDGTFPEHLMGALVRHSIARAVAQTLGLAPNLLSSSLTPTDSLRSASYLQQYSLAPSITDQLPYNFVAQPGDGLTAAELIPHVSDADAWSIQWGYMPLPYNYPEAESRYLVQFTTEHLAANPRHLWANGDGLNDPKCKPNDLGDDQPRAITLGIENLKRIAPYAAEWGASSRDIHFGSSNAQGYWQQISDKYLKYYIILSNNLTGRCRRPAPVPAEGTSYFRPEPEYVESCIQTLFDVFGEQARWLESDEAQRFSASMPEEIGLYEAKYVAGEPSVNILHNLHPSINLIDFTERFREFCFKQAKAGQAPDLYNRTLQSILVHTLIDNFNSRFDGNTTADERPASRHTLRRIQQQLQAVLPSAPDATTRAHYELLLRQLEDFFTIKPKSNNSNTFTGSFIITIG